MMHLSSLNYANIPMLSLILLLKNVTVEWREDKNIYNMEY